MCMRACVCTCKHVYGCAPCVHVCTWDDGHVNVQYVGMRQSAYIRANRFGRDVDLRARSFAR